MNPSASRIWNIPPPPGTEEEELSNCSSKRDGSLHSIGRAIDLIDPYIKAPEYIKFERKCSSEHSKYRSRSRSRSRARHHRSRHSRSRSKERYRRSRSRSRRRHRRRPSSSRSSSRSPNYRHSRRKHERRHKGSSSRYSRSRSRSRSTSRSRKMRGSRSKRDKNSTIPRKTIEEQPVLDADTNEVDMKIEEEEEEEEIEPAKDNVFKNDGSFLEMFKKMQEQQQQQKAQQESEVSTETKKPPMSVFGKRRGGKVLKTGKVQKVRLTSEEESNAQDAWSVYMKEVRRYKEACCDDDSKTRPLVK